MSYKFGAQTVPSAHRYGVGGLGVLGSAVPTIGPPYAYLYNDLSLPADANKEVRGLVITPPSAGAFFAYDDSSFTLTGAANGSYSFVYRLYVDGADMGTATATINVGAASTVTSVTVSPTTATGSTTFTSVVSGTNGPSQAVNWTATAGSINASGVFTAPAQTASVQTITITATSVQDGTKSGTATVTIAAAAASTVTSVTVAPATATGSQTFTATVSGTNGPSQAVTWSTTAGSIGASGGFTAPAQTASVQTITVTATSAQDGTKSGTATVTIAAAAAASTVTSVTVSPTTATGSTTFAAVVNGTGSPSQAVNWSTTAGSISAGGVFIAPAQTASAQTITITATSVQDGTKSGTATVTIAANLGDNIAPVMSGVLTESAVTQIGFTLAWNAATDNIAVTGYEYSIDAGSTYINIGQAGSSTTRTVNVGNLAPSTLYSTAVRAYDANGNKSAALQKSVTTLAMAGSYYLPAPRPYSSPSRMSHFFSPMR